MVAESHILTTRLFAWNPDIKIDSNFTIIQSFVIGPGLTSRIYFYQLDHYTSLPEPFLPGEALLHKLIPRFPQ